MDIEWEFIKGGVEMAEVHSYLRKQLNNDNTILTVAICVNTTHKAVAGSLYLPEEVYEKLVSEISYDDIQKYNESLINNSNININLTMNKDDYKNNKHIFEE